MTTPATQLAFEPLHFDEHGAPFSRRYGDVYASGDGPWGQATHVFLAGNGLPQRWAERREFTILETGFGLGTNFLASWAAWRDDARRPARLHFLSVEAHPLCAADLLAARARAPEHRDAPALRAQLAAQWPLPLAGLHRLEFEDGRVVLTLAFGAAGELVPRLQAGVDAFYLDGFAPERNPQVWQAPLMRALARLARPDATAASYTCARGVRDALGAAGFSVERAPGYGRKRAMLRARFAPPATARRRAPRAPYAGAREAIVVGAGLAGCSVAYALRRRGWNVALLDSAGVAGAGASGLPAGILQPLLSADDNAASRLTRAGLEYSRGLLCRMDAQVHAAGGQSLWVPCGVFHEAADAQDEADGRERLARWGMPAEFARHRTAPEAHALLGLRPCRGGAWFGRAGIVGPARWCRALVGAGVDGAQACQAFSVRHIEYGADAWRVFGDGGRSLEAPVLVLANGCEAARLLPWASLRLRALRGRLSLLAAPALRDLRAAISGDGFVLPPLLGAAAVGATYEVQEACDPGRAEPECAGAHERNLARLARLVAQPPAVQVQGAFSAVRCAARDHLPLAGALADERLARATGAALHGAHLADLPRWPGLYCLVALGSRGLTLGPLLGEHLASMLCGEPAPIDAPLAAAIDPARFLLRGLRRAAAPRAPGTPAAAPTLG